MDEQYRNSVRVVYDIMDKSGQKLIHYYHTFPKANIYAVCPEEVKSEVARTLTDLNRIVFIDDITDHVFQKTIDICDIQDETHMYAHTHIPMRAVRLLVNNDDLHIDNRKTDMQMFCTFHRLFQPWPTSTSFTFVGVNEAFHKRNSPTPNVIYEYDMKKYDPFLQKRGFMETSVYLHVYWNKLYEGKKMVGFCQYDTFHARKYDNLEENVIYMLPSGANVVDNNDEWDYIMFPERRNIDFLLDHYNKHHETTITKGNLKDMPVASWQTNIYPVAIYEKLCRWLEKLVVDVYPWSVLPPYETHFGVMGGYTERALGLFNAIQILQGTPWASMSPISLQALTIPKEQYSPSTRMNRFTPDIHCTMVEFSKEKLPGFCRMGDDNTQQLYRKAHHDVTNIHGYGYSKPVMVVVPNSGMNIHNLPQIENVLNANLDAYEIYYQEQGSGSNIYHIMLAHLSQ